MNDIMLALQKSYSSIDSLRQELLILRLNLVGRDQLNSLDEEFAKTEYSELAELLDVAFIDFHCIKVFLEMSLADMGEFQKHDEFDSLTHHGVVIDVARKLTTQLRLLQKSAASVRQDELEALLMYDFDGFERKLSSELAIAMAFAVKHPEIVLLDGEPVDGERVPVYENGKKRKYFPNEKTEIDFVVWMKDNWAQEGKIQPLCRRYILEIMPENFTVKGDLKRLNTLAHKTKWFWHPGKS